LAEVSTAGRGTDITCFAPSAPIRRPDCTKLALALILTAGTFPIQPGQFNGVSLGTCTYKVFNDEATNLQDYCFGTLGKIAFSQLDTGCPNDEAVCGGGTLLGASRFFAEQLPAGI